jgi:hypothetical protein
MSGCVAGEWGWNGGSVEPMCYDTTLIFLEYEIVVMGRCSIYVSVQVIPKVFKVQPVVLSVKFTFTSPVLL